MKKGRKKYLLQQKVSAVFLILTLLWLTVSTPFVCAFQQEMAKQQKAEQKSSPLAGTEEDSSRLGGNTEEKTPSGSTSFSEEYLHDHHPAHPLVYETSEFHKTTDADVYIAFHGELLVPPPNQS